MRLLLNIGLAVDATPSIAAHVALQILAANNFRVEAHAVHNSDTEPTLVAEIAVFDWPVQARQQLLQTSNDLRQDCIAAYNPVTKVGALIGHRTEEWGPFDPQRFINLDGSRLSAAV